MNEDGPLGHKQNHTDRFLFLRKQHLAKVVPIRNKVIADYELLSHSITTDKEANLLIVPTKSDSEIKSIKECQHCGNKFGFFDPKNVCKLCSKVVCANDSFLQRLLPPSTAAVPTCRKCHTFIKFSFHQEEIKRRLKEQSNSLTVVFYGTLMAIKNEIAADMPKFRGMVYSLNVAIFGDSPEAQDNLKRGIDDGGPLTVPGATLEELFVQATALQKQLQRVYAALEERMQGIQAEANDTRTQKKSISLLKQAISEFLAINLPEFRISSSRLAALKDQPKTKRLLLEAKEQIRLAAIAAARKEQEEADRKRYIETVGSDIGYGSSNQPNPTPASQPQSHDSGLATLKQKIVSKASQSSAGSFLSNALESISRSVENLNNPNHNVPEISGVIPAMCPTFGGIPLTIRGARFHPDVKIYVGNLLLDPTQVLFVSPTELKIISPVVDSEGPTDIFAQNPGQSTSGLLENILYFTNDPTILESFFGPSTPAFEEKGKSNIYSAEPSSSVIFSSSPPKLATSSNPVNPPSYTQTKSMGVSSSTSSNYVNYSKETTTIDQKPHSSSVWGQPSSISSNNIKISSSPPHYQSPVAENPPSYNQLYQNPIQPFGDRSEPVKFTSMGNPDRSEPTKYNNMANPSSTSSGPPPYSQTQNSSTSSGSPMKVSRTFGARN